MAYWLAKCNPKFYRIKERLADSNPTISWAVRAYRKEINTGDRVFVCLTAPHRAVVASMTVTQVAHKMPELESELRYCVQLDNTERWRILADLDPRFAPVEGSDLMQQTVLKDLPAFRKGMQGTMFRMSPEEGEAMLGLVCSEVV